MGIYPFEVIIMYVVTDEKLASRSIEEKAEFLGIDSTNESLISGNLDIAYREFDTVTNYINVLKTKSINLLMFNLLASIGFITMYIADHNLIINKTILDVSVILLISSIITTTYAMYHSGVYYVTINKENRKELNISRSDLDIKIYLLYALDIANTKNRESYLFSELIIFVSWLLFLSNMIVNLIYIVLFN